MTIDEMSIGEPNGVDNHRAEKQGVRHGVALSETPLEPERQRLRPAYDDVVVACIQQRLRIYATLAEYRTDLQRFLRIAQHKQAQLVVFPELAGIMLAPPLLRSYRLAMLKSADLSTRRRASWSQRTVGRMAKWGTQFLQLDLFDEIARWLGVVDGWQHYCDLFGGLAREFQVVLVAPSAYLPDPTDGVIRNIAGVFGSSGALLGYQAKVMLHEQDRPFAQPGVDWQVIPTPVGTLGLMLGSDVLLPEVGRLLAYKGADMVVAQGACRDLNFYHKLRAGLWASVQENHLFAAANFLVGRTTFHRHENDLFVGRSAILAPPALTLRANGVLVEMGNPRSEGVLSANWNFAALKGVWEMSDLPAHKALPFKQLSTMIASLYSRLQTISNSTGAAEPATTAASDEATTPLLPVQEPVLQLDELAITNTITRRWPLTKLDYPLLVRTEGTELPSRLQPPLAPSAQQVIEVIKPAPESYIPSSIAEDETEEMDALGGDGDADQPKS
ncbi:MAG: hypothetical protein KF832_16875 [Caldilineaceae bacterium]|nr:hypothetical protein [Caldilineaceae bacterium]